MLYENISFNFSYLLIYGWALIIDSIYSQCVNIAADRRKKMILGEMD